MLVQESTPILKQMTHDTNSGSSNEL